MDISQNLSALAAQAQADCRAQFEAIDAVAEKNTLRVLDAFRAEEVSASHFAPTDGYGYGDRGRDCLDRIYARVFGCEDALVRHTFINGTHTIATALFGVLRPGDSLVSLTGKPYDTLYEVIGISGDGKAGSLRDFGVEYRELALKDGISVDFEGIPKAVEGAKAVFVQRSKGYSLRDTLSPEEIGEIVRAVKCANPDCVVMVDNCYGEFVCEHEPSHFGADLVMGSLIKNPGGGIAATGGYIAGRGDLVELCSYRATTPGIGREAGCTLGQTKPMMMGFLLAPAAVAGAVKTAVFAARLFELMGFGVAPRYDERRGDIIQALMLKEPKTLISFCKGIQKGSPVDSFVTPEPWAMPGYDSEVIMAAGAFTMGSSIELSADAPLREPYAVWLQGGLNFALGKAGVLSAAQALVEDGIWR